MSISWKNKRNSLPILALLWCLAEPCYAGARQFVSLRRTGVIWVMPPLASNWEKLKKDEIEEGSLLRLMPEASIELKQTGNNLSSAEVEARLRIAEPIILRMDRQIFKKIRYQDYVIDGLWNDGASQEKESTSNPLLSFSAAFVRHFLSLETEQELPKLKADPQKATLESGEKINNLVLLSPQQDSLHFIDKKLVEIPLFWESPRDDMSYKIFLWSADDVKREPLVTVKGHHYLLNISKIGRYRLQISSTDHLYRSEVLRFEVDRPLAEIVYNDDMEEQFAKANIKISSNLKFQYPPEDFAIIAQDARVESLFVWLDKEGLKAGDEYKLIVQGKKAGEHKEVATQQNSAKIRLSPGDYHFFVLKQNKITQSKTIASASQRLQIQSRSNSSTWHQLGRKIHEAQRDEIVLIDIH